MGTMEQAPTNPVERAIEMLGSEKKLGDKAGYSQVAINKAKHRVAAGGQISADMAVALDRATGGQIPKHETRPDLFDPPTPAEPIAEPAE